MSTRRQMRFQGVGKIVDVDDDPPRLLRPKLLEDMVEDPLPLTLISGFGLVAGTSVCAYSTEFA